MSNLVTTENFEQIMRELGAMGIMATQVIRPVRAFPGSQHYHPFAQGWVTYAPWHRDKRIATVLGRLQARKLAALVASDRAWTLIHAFRHTLPLPGEVWEAGVYQGGSASLLKLLAQQAAAEPGGRATQLRLFDSFEGLPATDHPLDLHRQGDFADTSLETVRETVGPEDWIDFRKGWIPASFAGLESSRIRFAHVDVDLYQPILDCCEFIYPRLVPGGMLVFDDYGLASCPGAREAVDKFFQGRPESPFALINGQCVVVRHPH